VNKGECDVIFQEKIGLTMGKHKIRTLVHGDNFGVFLCLILLGNCKLKLQ